MVMYAQFKGFLLMFAKEKQLPSLVKVVLESQSLLIRS